MRNSKIGQLLILQLVLVVAFCVSWGGNLYKLSECDFKHSSGTDFQCEVIHAIGVIPPASLITVWVGTDEDNDGDS